MRYNVERKRLKLSSKNALLNYWLESKILFLLMFSNKFSGVGKFLVAQMLLSLSSGKRASKTAQKRN